MWLEHTMHDVWLHKLEHTKMILEREEVTW